MHTPLKILGIPGSLRLSSYNYAALVAAQKLVPDGVVLDIIDLDGIDLFNQDTEHQPNDKLIEFKQRIRDADAILFSTPEYNYSIPGVLKNAIDAASRPYGDSAWTGKPVAVMGASIGAFGTARAQYHLRQCFITLKMFALTQPEVMIPHADKVFDADGNLTDQNSQKLIRQLLESLAALTLQLDKK
ncbi:NAD(P)H-dependent FMN reductase [soil metagenome]